MKHRLLLCTDVATTQEKFSFCPSLDACFLSGITQKRQRGFISVWCSQNKTRALYSNELNEWRTGELVQRRKKQRRSSCRPSVMSTPFTTIL